MKKLAIVLAFAILASCQSETKSDKVIDSAANAVAPTIDSLTYTYDSVKVYSKNKISRDSRVTDTAKAVISYPVFTDDAVNKFVVQNILNTADHEKSYKTVQEYATDFIKGFDDFQVDNEDRIQTWFLDIETKVVAQQTDYLSMLTTCVNYSGGAHPNTVFIYANFNTATHQEILLDSLLQPGGMPKLNAIAEKIFRKNEKLTPTQSLKDNYFFEKDVFKLNNNFTITKEGLKFLYNPYEIKAYAYGKTELTIPFNELKDIIKPNSLLSQAH